MEILSPTTILALDDADRIGLDVGKEKGGRGVSRLKI